MRPPLDIGIVGCGIAGLAVGTLLAREGHRVRVFDRLDAPAPVGSGLILQPVGLAVLDKLGLSEEIAALGARIERLFGRVVPSGRIVLDVRYGALEEEGVGLSVHRAALFHVLHMAARRAGVGIESGCEVVATEARAGGRTGLLFTSRSSNSGFDLVIDAGGLRSPLAGSFRGVLPYGALWVNVPWPEGSGFNPMALEQRYRRADRMVGVLPIGRLPGARAAQAALFWSLRAADEAPWRAEPLDLWKAELTGLWPEAGALLASVRSHADLVFARYAHRTNAPVAGGIARIGDSYHAASPQLGQGANMALLDAWALTRAVARGGDLSSALADYARARRWHVRLYQLASLLFTPAYQSDSRLLPFVRDHIASPLSRFGPAPRLLAALVAGKIGWPFRRCHL